MAFSLLIEFIPVKEVKCFTNPGLCRVVIKTICCRDGRTGESIERFAYPVVLSLRKSLLHDVTESIEREVDLPTLQILIFIAIEKGENDVVVIGCGETIFVRAE